MPKPVRKRRHFIDKRRDKVTKFSLVHRSQRDPLVTDQNAPQRLLHPITPEDHRKEQQREFGVYYDDNYDYLQHLKDPKSGEDVHWEEVESFKIEKPVEKTTQNKGKLQLPSSVFASKYEEDVGLLNRAAPRSGPLVGFDPELLEVLETLDDDYKVEEVVNAEDLAKELELEDEIEEEEGEEDYEEGDEDDEEGDLDDILANIVAGEDPNAESEEEERSDVGSDFAYGSEDEDQLGDLPRGKRMNMYDFEEEETKSKFTEYSMSSSVVARSEQLAVLDDRFEKFFDDYEEENTGGLDMDEIEGHKSESSALMKQIVDQFETEQKTRRQPPVHLKSTYNPEDSDSDNQAETELLEADEPVEKWDCESILSTYSNIYHHPKLISEPSKKIAPIKVSGKTGIPKDVLGKSGLTASALRRLDLETGVEPSSYDLETRTIASRVSELSIRNKHETLEEKKARKGALKEFRRERRLEKKCNKDAFKDEKGRQEKIQINNRKNIQGQKLV